MDKESLHNKALCNDALHGLGVLVTRPRRQAEAFAQRLRAHGAQPLILSTIEIAPPLDAQSLQQARMQLGEYRFVMFVSPNAVEQALAGLSDMAGWPSTTTALAPGQGTADALRAAGVPAVNILTPTDHFDSEGLLALPSLQQVRDASVLILRGETGRELLGETLEARGARVARVVCYRRVRPAGDAGALLPWLHAGRLQALTFTASEALDNFHAMAGRAVLAMVQRQPAFVTHERIAAHARSLGWQAELTAGGDDGLIQGMRTYFSSPGAVR